MPIDNSEVLYSEDIAAKMGVSVRTARRVLLRLENEYPNRFVGKEAGRRFIHKQDFDKIYMYGASSLSDVYERLEKFERRLHRLESRILPDITVRKT